MKVFVYLRPNLHLLSGYHLTFQKKKKKSPVLETFRHVLIGLRQNQRHKCGMLFFEKKTTTKE